MAVFGGKTVIYLEPLAVRLSQRAGRPVKLVMDRDDFRATGPTSGTRIKVKIVSFQRRENNRSRSVDGL